jgi:hypothetical protein
MMKGYQEEVYWNQQHGRHDRQAVRPRCESLPGIAFWSGFGGKGIKSREMLARFEG